MSEKSERARHTVFRWGPCRDGRTQATVERQHRLYDVDRSLCLPVVVLCRVCTEHVLDSAEYLVVLPSQWSQRGAAIHRQDGGYSGDVSGRCRGSSVRAMSNGRPGIDKGLTTVMREGCTGDAYLGCGVLVPLLLT